MVNICYSNTCTDCGGAIVLMSSCQYDNGSQVLCSSIYHCENCHTDWELESTVDGQTYELRRKFWG
jgi:hypothetical protein